MALKDNLVVCFGLDEASGTRSDDHTSGYTLTDNNTVGSETGKTGANAATFVAANSESLTRGHDTDLACAGDKSGSCWVKPTSTGLSGNRMLMGQFTGTAAGSWRLRLENGKPVILATDGSVNKKATWGSSLSAGTWYFVTWWYDSTADTININVDQGTPVSTSTTGWSPQEGTTGFAIGARADGGNWFFDGAIDQCAVWDYVQTSANFDEIYNSGSGLAFSSWDGGGGGDPEGRLIGGKLIRGGLLGGRLVG